MAFYDPADTLSTALHVIATERDALSHLESLYRSDAQAQRDLERAVHQLVQTIKQGGKLVICGVGKSGKIGRKLEATMNSVGIHSVFLHPTEALHGDLGVIRAVRFPERCEMTMMMMK
jgi:D-arabinose 5-phosphate isomerase GutQ